MSLLKKHSLTRLIFLRTASGILAASLACMAITLGFLYSAFLDESRDSLRDESASIATGIEMGGLSFLEHLSPREHLRVTWVDAQGRVLFDSQSDPAQMDNHADRSEIRAALAVGEGESSRVSGTMSQWTIYRALRISDGSVVRLSLMEASPLSMLSDAIIPLLVLLLFIMALAVVLAAATSRKIVAPINRIDLQSPQSGSVYTELLPLTQRIAAQNQQIQNQMRLQAETHEAQDRFRREFTANVSHELKTPLTSISGFAEIIRDGLVKPEDIPHFADNIYREAQRLIVLVIDIIKISRIDDHLIPMQRESVDLYQLSEVILDRLAPAAEKKNVTLHLSGDHAEISGSYQVADEMIYNLCDNAIKYNRPGGDVHVSIRVDSGCITLRVRDTGIGIPQEHHERIFERFYRVDKNRSCENGGTGLGLSIVKHAAAFHNAKLSIESTPNEGTEIIVSFPKQTQAGA